MQSNEEKVWKVAQEQLSRKLSIPAYELWLRNAQLIELTTDQAVIGVSNSMAKTFLCNDYLQVIGEAISEVIGKSLSVSIVVDASLAPPLHESSWRALATVSPHAPGSLTSKWTFDNFVVGAHNHLAYGAAREVAEKPGQTYNPLFIYGGLGLGKSHILRAIENHILRHRQDLAVRFVTCEGFINELISHIRDDRMNDFRRRFRRVDLLLIDDVQNLAGKQATQEELFHTFNMLRDHGKQVVLSCSSPPKSMGANIGEHLRNRFDWGLTVEIQPPDFETRMTILRRMAERHNLIIQDHVLEHIALICTSSIMELEGMLMRVMGYAHMTGCPIDLNVLVAVLKG